MEGFLKFVVIAILVIYLLGFLFRLLLRYYIKRMAKRFEGFANQTQSRPEGDITVDEPSKQRKKVDKNMGEYVDYEEV